MSGDKASKDRVPESWPTPWRDPQAEDASPREALLLKMAQAAAEDPSEPRPGAEARVLAGLRDRKASHRWLVVATGAVGAALLVLLIVQLSTTPPSRPASRTLLSNVAVVRGQAFLADARVLAGALPRALAAGEDLRSSGETLVVADLVGAGKMIVHSATTVALPLDQQAADRLAFSLQRGEVVLHVVPGLPRVVTVETPDAQVRVTGTVFAVSVQEGHTRVAVWRGSVEVTQGSARRRIEAGQSLSTADHLELPQLVRPLGEEEMLLLGYIEERTAGGILLPAPKAAGGGPAELAPAPRETPKRPPPVEDRTRPRSLLEQEQRLVVLASGAGEAAANALFSLGSLRYDILADADGAIAAFEEYLRRFPDGVFASETHLALFDALRAKQRFKEAVVHGQRALEGLQDPGRRRELTLGLAEIFHLRLDSPERGLELYLQVVGGDDELAERASYLVADCHLKMKAPTKARQALEEYLRRFPAGRYHRQAAAALSGDNW